jgi:hypothetical protein
MPDRYAVGKQYWWKAFEGVRILVRCIQENERYLAVKILTISEAAAVRTRYGAGEVVNLARLNAPLEEVV